MVRLNAQGWNAPAIAEMFECCEHTVRATLRRWQQLGLGGLWDAPGRGDKPRWQAADLTGAVLRAGSSHLQQSTIGTKAGTAVKLSADRIRRLMKKGLAMETHPPQPQTQARPNCQSHQADFDTLKQAEGRAPAPEIPGRVGVLSVESSEL